MILIIPLPQMFAAMMITMATSASHQQLDALETAEGARFKPMRMMMGPVTTGGDVYKRQVLIHTGKKASMELSVQARGDSLHGGKIIPHIQFFKEATLPPTPSAGIPPEPGPLSQVQAVLPTFHRWPKASAAPPPAYREASL